MTPEELDEARAEKAGGNPVKAARLAREGWTPPEPVDPDVLAARNWSMEQGHPLNPDEMSEGAYDKSAPIRAYLAGARMAREQERGRADHVVAFTVRVMAGGFSHLDQAKFVAKEALAKYREDRP